MTHYPQTATLFAAATRAAAVANSAGASVEDTAAAKRVCILLDVSATAGVAGDVLDVFVDVLGPDGTTWLNAVHFPQVAGDAAAVKHFAVLDPSAPAATSFNVTADCAAGDTRPYLWGLALRGRYTLVDAGGHGQSVAFSLTALLQ